MHQKPNNLAHRLSFLSSFCSRFGLRKSNVLIQSALQVCLISSKYKGLSCDWNHCQDICFKWLLQFWISYTVLLATSGLLAYLFQVGVAILNQSWVLKLCKLNFFVTSGSTVHQSEASLSWQSLLVNCVLCWKSDNSVLVHVCFNSWMGDGYNFICMEFRLLYVGIRVQGNKCPTICS